MYKTMNMIDHDSLVGRSVIITHISAVGTEYREVETGSIHEIIEKPRNAIHRNPGAIWINGQNEPIVLLPGEYELIEE